MLVILFLMSIKSMSHVDFKKWPYCPVEFKGQEPPFVGFNNLAARHVTDGKVSIMTRNRSFGGTHKYT